MLNGKKLSEQREMNYRSALVFGASDDKDLVQICTVSGIGPSMRYSKQARNVAKLMTVQSPHLLLSDLAQGMANDSDCLIEISFYPFGGFAKTAIYANTVASGSIQLLPKGDFDVIDCDLKGGILENI